MSEHQPGPWRQEGTHIVDANGKDVIAGGTVWPAGHIKQRDDYPMIEANQALIVSAPALRAALEQIANLEDTAPVYADWGGDTEDAENWGLAAGRTEAANIARKVLGMPPIEDPDTGEEEIAVSRMACLECGLDFEPDEGSDVDGPGTWTCHECQEKAQ